LALHRRSGFRDRTKEKDLTPGWGSSNVCWKKLRVSGPPLESLAIQQIFPELPLSALNEDEFKPFRDSNLLTDGISCGLARRIPWG